MKPTESFKEAIKKYLDERAGTDELFAVTYAKENKNIDECCSYIMGEALKASADIGSGVKGCGMDNDDVFNLAVHYYDEDNIKDIKPVNARVVVNHIVALTEEEKKEAHEEAVKKYEANELKKIEDARKKRLEKKAEKATKQEVQPSLFEF